MLRTASSGRRIARSVGKEPAASLADIRIDWMRHMRRSPTTARPHPLRAHRIPHCGKLVVFLGPGPGEISKVAGIFLVSPLCLVDAKCACA